MATSLTPPDAHTDTHNDTPPSGGSAADAGSEMLDRVRQNAHQTIDRLADTAAPHVQRLQQGVASAEQVLHDKADGLRQTRDEWTENLRCTVRENPVASVCAAFAIGMLVSRLTRR